MVTSYFIIIAKHRLPDTTFIHLVSASSEYLVGYILMVRVKSLIQIAFSHTYTHIEKVEKINV